MKKEKYDGLNFEEMESAHEFSLGGLGSWAIVVSAIVVIAKLVVNLW